MQPLARRQLPAMSILRFSRRSTNSASPSTSATCCSARPPAPNSRPSRHPRQWLSMPSSIRLRKRPPIATNLPNSASSSARLAKPCASIPTSSESISARSFPCATTITPPSIQPSFPMARLCISPRECAALWNWLPTSASIPAERVSSNAPSSSPTRRLTSPTSKDAPHLCATRTSFTLLSSRSTSTNVPRSSTPRSRTGIRAISSAKAVSITSSPSAPSALATSRRSRGHRSRQVRPSPGSIPPACSRATTVRENSIRWLSPTTTRKPTPAPR